jgi:CRISPR type III-A-associated RAMP protein Csm4
MNPGLVVKLRPTGPWRIGPDSGARNRVDSIYHSDSLYSAVTAAMVRLGSLEDWLDATARSAAPAVCFSSCFPFQEATRFVIPPQTVWPPAAALLSARVRWKGARFVPLEIVRTVIGGQTLDESRWTVDGPSECLVPAGRSGPFRTAVRWSAAVDRLTGATERHSTACIEFRAGAGWWTLVSFVDEAAESRWKDPVKAAFRLLADTGFGGERSRGWGRAEAPEFIDGVLPELILGSVPNPAPGPDVQPVPPVEEPPPAEPPVKEPEPPVTEPEAWVKEPEPPPEEPEPPVTEPEPPVTEPGPAMAMAAAASSEEAPAAEPLAAEPETPPVLEAALVAGVAVEALPVPERAPSTESAHWLLSLFSPAPADTVDWGRGKYTVLTRGGRVDSPAGSGELKKQVQMVTEGSVLYAATAPCGAAPDVAPEGFAHPVFRAGFALAIPLPEGS